MGGFCNAAVGPSHGPGLPNQPPPASMCSAGWQKRKVHALPVHRFPTPVQVPDFSTNFGHLACNGSGYWTFMNTFLPSKSFRSTEVDCMHAFALPKYFSCPRSSQQVPSQQQRTACEAPSPGAGPTCSSLMLSLSAAHGASAPWSLGRSGNWQAGWWGEVDSPGGSALGVGPPLLLTQLVVDTLPSPMSTALSGTSACQ